MKKMASVRAEILALLLIAGAFPATATAQTFEALGTRAQGMGGAFVAVADDASAVYWNPAGLATSGRLFSIVLDSSQSDVEPADLTRGGSQSGNLVAVGTPPLGLSYYRLAVTRLRTGPGPFLYSTQTDRLVTHNVGITLVQSVISRVAIATTLRAVRGTAASTTIVGRASESMLDTASDIPSLSKTTFDADIGVLAMLGTFRAGVTVRNLREPEFETAGDTTLEVKRQSRAGVSYQGVSGLIVSADMDLERAIGSITEERNFAAGLEAQLFPRVFVRSGFRVNTLEDETHGRTPVFTLGGGVLTYKSLIVDAQFTGGSKYGNRGWGIAGRLVY